MNLWTEFQIGSIYFAGLIVTLIAWIVILLYLNPIKTTIFKITGRFTSLWNQSFKASLLFAGLLGAMSVTFTDCSGSYSFLLDSRNETIMKGLEQVSTSFDYFAIILGFWLVFFIILRFAAIKKSKLSSK